MRRQHGSLRTSNVELARAQAATGTHLLALATVQVLPCLPALSLGTDPAWHAMTVAQASCGSSLLATGCCSCPEAVL